jgi:hypothetical protein
MAPARPPSLAQAHPYRLPKLLEDIRLLDLLELSGTTVRTSRLMQLSQPTISRRYRSLAADFGLVRDRRQLWGCGYGTSASMRLLRLGCRAHRLAAGMARIGSDLLHHPLLAGCPWLLPTPQRFRAAAYWLELVRQGVLDGALISGLELEAAAGLNDQELELLPLGELPLALAFCPEAPGLVSGGQVSEVLVPDRGVAPGLWRLLQELGLSLRNGGNSLQTPDDWIGRIQGSTLALVVADREADTWAALQRWPLGHGPLGQGALPSSTHSPVWLVLPADWQQHQVLRHTAQELGRIAAAQQQEG